MSIPALSLSLLNRTVNHYELILFHLNMDQPVFDLRDCINYDANSRSHINSGTGFPLTCDCPSSQAKHCRCSQIVVTSTLPAEKDLSCWAWLFEEPCTCEKLSKSHRGSKVRHSQSVFKTLQVKLQLIELCFG